MVATHFLVTRADPGSSGRLSGEATELNGAVSMFWEKRKVHHDLL